MSRDIKRLTKFLRSTKRSPLSASGRPRSGQHGNYVFGCRQVALLQFEFSRNSPKGVNRWHRWKTMRFYLCKCISSRKNSSKSICWTERFINFPASPDCWIAIAIMNSDENVEGNPLFCSLPHIIHYLTLIILHAIDNRSVWTAEILRWWERFQRHLGTILLLNNFDSKIVTFGYFLLTKTYLFLD